MTFEASRKAGGVPNQRLKDRVSGHATNGDLALASFTSRVAFTPTHLSGARCPSVGDCCDVKPTIGTSEVAGNAPVPLRAGGSNLRACGCAASGNPKRGLFARLIHLMNHRRSHLISGAYLKDEMQHPKAVDARGCAFELSPQSGNCIDFSGPGDTTWRVVRYVAIPPTPGPV